MELILEQSSTKMEDNGLKVHSSFCKTQPLKILFFSCTNEYFHINNDYVLKCKVQLAVKNSLILITRVCSSPQLNRTSLHLSALCFVLMASTLLSNILYQAQQEAVSMHRFIIIPGYQMPRWRLCIPIEVACLPHMLKKLLASRFTSAVCSPLNMCSGVSPSGSARQVLRGSQTLHYDDVTDFKIDFFFLAPGIFYKYKAFIDQKFKIESVIINLVLSKWYLGPRGFFFAAIPQVASEKN